MKKTFIFLIIFFISIGCSTNENSKNTKVNVPESPTNLVGVIVSNTQINIEWDDNSTNESGFKIERKTAETEYEIIGVTNPNIHQYSDTNVIENTTYSYRIFSFNQEGNSTFTSNEITIVVTIWIPPTLITTIVTEITSGSGVSGGVISNVDTSNMISQGIVWSTSPNPTIDLPTKTIEAVGTSPFTSYILGLIYNTTYHVRSYATYSFGTFYGNDVSFTTSTNIPVSNIPGPTVTDVEGNVMQSVINCTQIWTTKNMNVSTYDDGTPIPEVTDPIQWANLTTGAWCYYNNDPVYGLLYGKLYNWYAVAGIYDDASFLNPTLRKKLVPSGWHIATNSEWNTIAQCLGGYLVAGGKMKSVDKDNWDEPNVSATNSSGFSAIPGGFRNLEGVFYNIGQTTCWWSSSPLTEELAYFRSVDYFNSRLTTNDYRKTYGFSVRCLKD